jgi:Zn-dependent protease
VTAAEAPGPKTCLACGTELAPSFLACPACGKLVHGDALKALAAEAEAASSAGDARAALAKWRQVLALLPPGSGQHGRVLETVQGLSATIDAAPQAAGAAPARPAKKRGKLYAALAAGGALLLKFKYVLLFLLGKGKLLLVGLFQAKTMLTMALATGVYAGAHGWKFAVGLIVSIYVHEMGHVERLRHYGIPASAPMFVPGLGAFVRLKQHPATVREDARVGLAGPIWGALAAVAFLVAGRWTHHPGAVAVGHVGAWINLFNLIPVWQLDGGRAFNAFSRRQRVTAAVLLWILAFMRIDGMFFLLALGASYRAWSKPVPEEGDGGAFWIYVVLVVGLAALVVVGK